MQRGGLFFAAASNFRARDFPFAHECAPKVLMKRSTGEHLGRVTVSIGAAALRKGETAQSLIERADNCLYAAKRCGRNRVMCETDPEVESVSAAEVA